MTWEELKVLAIKAIPIENRQSYVDRIKYEIQQIELQGAADYWLDLYEKGDKFENNPNGLVLPLLIGITDVDPIGRFYKLDDDGSDDDIVDITTYDGKILSLPGRCKVQTTRGMVFINNLVPDDELLDDRIEE